MNKLAKLAAVALVSSFVLSPIAEARDGFYLAVRGGMVWNNYNNKKDAVSDEALSSIGRVYEFSGAIGYRYKFFRGEIEVVNRDDADEEYINNAGIHSDDFTVGSTSYMLNGYIDFLPNYWISPFITGGIGYSKLELSDTLVDVTPNIHHQWKKSRAFTWQAGAGLSIRINKCLNIDTGYRYWTLGKIHDAEVNAHEWFAGLRFTF